MAGSVIRRTQRGGKGGRGGKRVGNQKCGSGGTEKGSGLRLWRLGQASPTKETLNGKGIKLHERRSGSF